MDRPPLKLEPTPGGVSAPPPYGGDKTLPEGRRTLLLSCARLRFWAGPPRFSELAPADVISICEQPRRHIWWRSGDRRARPASVAAAGNQVR